MKVDVYKIEGTNEYIMVPAGTEVSSITIPNLGQRKLKYLKTIDLDTGPLIGVDEKEAKSKIESKGYYICAVKVESQLNQDSGPRP